MTEQAKGNFRINLNRNKKPGDSQPTFDRGVISAPDDPATQFEFKLWAYKDKHGKPFYAGPSSSVSAGATALEAASALMPENIDTAAVSPLGDGTLQLAAQQVMLFPNTFKTAKADPAYAGLSAEEKAVNDKRPDVWGYWNPGHGKPQLKVAAWDIAGRYGPFLGGNTQVTIPGSNIATEPQPELPAPESTSRKARAGRSDVRVR